MPRVPVYGNATGDAATAPGDGLSEKLVKYVPAEALAFYVPVVAMTGVKNELSMLVLVTAAGLAGTVIWLYNRAQLVKPPERRPRPWFYVLAGLAFLAWALGTVPEISTLSGLDPTYAALAIPIAVLLIPGIDEALTPN